MEKIVNLNDVQSLLKDGSIKEGDTIAFIADVITKEAKKRYGTGACDVTHMNTVATIYFNETKKEAFDVLESKETFYFVGKLRVTFNEFSFDAIDVKKSIILYSMMRNEEVSAIVAKNEHLEELLNAISDLNFGAAIKLIDTNSDLQSLIRENGNLYAIFIKECCSSDIFNAEMVKKLIDCGLDNYRSGFDNSQLPACLVYTVVSDDVRNNEELKKAYADVALHYLKVTNFSSNETDINLDTVLSSLCCNDVFIECVKYLIAKPEIEINTVNDIDFSPLGNAIRFNCPQIVNELLKRPDIIITDKDREEAKRVGIKLP